ncbi:hypothetical protein MT418_007591 [Batrachochytrium dendrobatidis]
MHSIVYVVIFVLTEYVCATSTPYTYGGNRTTYPNGSTRNDSAISNPDFKTTGSGHVNIRAMPTQSAPSASSLQLQASWAKLNNITIAYSSYPNLPKTNNDVAGAILDACRDLNQTHDTFDLVWISVDMIGDVSDCFIDLWAWDDGFGQNLQKDLLDAGVVSDRLVAIPADIQTTMLMYNKNYLSVHGYYTPPTSIQDMEFMLQDILQNERAVENYKLSGYTSSFQDPQSWPILVSEWIACSNASIITPDGNVTIADSDFALLLTHISTWVNTGIIDLNDIDTFGQSEALSRFVQGQAVFLHTTSNDLAAVLGRNGNSAVIFDVGVIGMPALNGIGSGIGGADTFGVVDGYALAVYRYSKNIDAALKVLEYLVSDVYEKSEFTSPDEQGDFDFPINRHLLQDPVIATHLTDPITNLYQNITLTNRPATMVGSHYNNISLLITATMTNIFHGVSDIRTLLDELDTKLLKELGKKPRNTLTDVDNAPPPVITLPGRKQIQYMGVQVALLFIVIGITVGVILCRRYFELYPHMFDLDRRGGSGNSATGVKDDWMSAAKHIFTTKPRINTASTKQWNLNTPSDNTHFSTPSKSIAVADETRDSRQGSLTSHPSKLTTPNGPQVSEKTRLVGSEKDYHESHSSGSLENVDLDYNLESVRLVQ